MNGSNSNIAVNGFLEVPKIPHKIMEHLISSKSESAENIWKMLKYNDINALSKENLTVKEKNALRYLGQANTQDTYKIFLKPTISDSLVDSSAQTNIKMYRIATQPTNRMIATIAFEFDFYTGESTGIIIYDGCYVEKTDLFEAFWLDLFNGKDIGLGSSELSYNREMSRLAQSMLDLGNSKSLYGRSLVMTLEWSNIDTGVGCG